MDKTILIQKRTHYGTNHIYIVSEHAGPIEKLTGRKTLTQRDIDGLKELGYTFGVKLEEITI